MKRGRKFQKRYFLENLTNIETDSEQQHNAHMYKDRFQDHLYVASALSDFEVLTKPSSNCNEGRRFYATQYQDIFIQYKEDFNIDTAKPRRNLRFPYENS